MDPAFPSRQGASVAFVIISLYLCDCCCYLEPGKIFIFRISAFFRVRLNLVCCAYAEVISVNFVVGKISYCGTEELMLY